MLFSGKNYFLDFTQEVIVTPDGVYEASVMLKCQMVYQQVMRHI